MEQLLRNTRLKYGLSQLKMGKMLDMSQSAIHKLEKGDLFLTLRSAVLLNKEFKVPVSTIFKAAREQHLGTKK